MSKHIATLARGQQRCTHHEVYVELIVVLEVVHECLKAMLLTANLRHTTESTSVSHIQVENVATVSLHSQLYINITEHVRRQQIETGTCRWDITKGSGPCYKSKPITTRYSSSFILLQFSATFRQSSDLARLLIHLSSLCCWFTCPGHFVTSSGTLVVLQYSGGQETRCWLLSWLTHLLEVTEGVEYDCVTPTD